MTKNIERNEEKMKTLNQHGQGHCDQSLTSTEVFTGPCKQDADDKMPELKKKKRKSRGDRKGQHKRRRLRRQLQKANEHQNPAQPNVVC